MKGITKFLHLHVSDLWLVLRAAVLYALSLIAIRLVGKRTIGQLSPFDLLAIVIPVSYTHLDVYKRQARWSAGTEQEGVRVCRFGRISSELPN